MADFVAFLRGMNLGRRRITNDELCTHFGELGFTGVSAFLASGNVVFTSPDGATDVAQRIEEGLRAALDYDVPTFLRTADEVRAIAERRPFDPDRGPDGGKVQVAMLHRAPPAAARRTVLALATDDDRLALHGRELYWLPRGRLSDSALDFAFVGRTIGPMTVRTQRTLERIAAKYFAD